MDEEVVLNDIYILVLWPESQEYMEKEWFDTEAVLADVFNENHELAEESSAYFIPIKYINKEISIKWKKE